jgi:hypothetical protein
MTKVTLFLDGGSNLVFQPTREPKEREKLAKSFEF